jgi:hypothetical protein
MGSHAQFIILMCIEQHLMGSEDANVLEAAGYNSKAACELEVETNFGQTILDI